MVENGGVEMKLYHATTVSGLHCLKTNSLDREGNQVLYLTDNYPYSLFYIRDREIDFVTCGVREGGIVHYDEKFHDQLEVLYKEMSGWVYEVETEAEPTQINGIYVVHKPVDVIAATYISDALKEIRIEMGKGTIRFLSFSDLTEEQKVQNHRGMVQWFLSMQKHRSKKIVFLWEHFPEAWEEAENILAES